MMRSLQKSNCWIHVKRRRMQWWFCNLLKQACKQQEGDILQNIFSTEESCKTDQATLNPKPMQNFCTRYILQQVRFRKLCKKMYVCMWGYKKEEQKTRIACTLVANCKCYDGGMVACKEVFPSSFYIPWMSFWDLYKTCFAQPLFGFLCCNTTTTKPNHNPPPPGSREKPSSSFLRIQSERKPSQNKTQKNPTSQNQTPTSPKTQSGVLWEIDKRKE